MRYKIFKDGELINTIIADEVFCASYCKKHGYIYEMEVIETPDIDPKPTESEQLRADIDYVLMILED